MHKIIKTSFFLILSCLLTLIACAQEIPDSEKTPAMADAMRSNGKIYVVVAVVLIVLTGMFIYLIRLDRKINKLEKGA